MFESSIRSGTALWGRHAIPNCRIVKMGSSVNSSCQHCMTPIDPKASGIVKKHYLLIIICVIDDIGASPQHSDHPRESGSRTQFLGLALSFSRPSLTGSVLLTESRSLLPYTRKNHQRGRSKVLFPVADGQSRVYGLFVRSTSHDSDLPGRL